MISFNVFSEPWVNVYDLKQLDGINHQLRTCNHSGDGYISFPVSYGEIDFYLEKIKKINIDNTVCKKNIDNIKIYLRNKFITTREVVFGVQSGTDDQYFQTKGNRYYKSSNYHFSLSDINSNIAYKVKVINAYEENKNYFDESYISYKYKNHIFTAGRVNRWWSPSDSYSLILSNSARPSTGIEYKNYKPIEPRLNFLKFLGPVNYEFFINKLEKERAIPNTLLFGNRVSFKPHASFKLSLMRTAQFGGKNRPTDGRTILNMLIGKDNEPSTSSSFLEAPGNQLAGFDFLYNPKKIRNLKIYGQTIGEDESGFLPSKTMSLYGFSYSFSDINTSELSIDYIDTFVGDKNFAYNHVLYQSGYRYYGMPIGASIDADSEALKLTLYTAYKDFDFKFSLAEIHLNKNDSSLNYWTKESTELNQFDLSIKYQYKKSYIDLIYTHRNNKFNSYGKNNLFLNLYFKF